MATHSESLENNMRLWNLVCQTDQKYTKEFVRGQGFRGTAINPMYSIRRATERWGPVGGKWGWTVLDEKYIDGAPLFVNGIKEGCEVIHTVLVNVYYPLDFDHPIHGTKVGHVVHSGATMAVVKRGTPGYLVSDEEHRKKSLTDAISKALSVLGFSADIWMGGSGFVDNKYVNDATGHQSQQVPQKQQQDTPFGRATLAIAEAKDLGDLAKIEGRIKISETINEQQKAALFANVNAKRQELQPQGA